jgi:hypothetical protein|tara:strand:+ start:426 stop:668 length:243 start_codon:yes stop_codon:yes gene_type:complete
MKLKVTSYREFNTRRGVGYECKTNVKGIEIWNDGNGGGTFIENSERNDEYHHLTEYQLEILIDEFLGITPYRGYLQRLEE